jgi:ubiquinone/menaquinone biosynthesis C-methylase UbiE
MKLNWAERWVVNNPLMIFKQKIEIAWFKRMMPLVPGKTVLEMGCGRGAGAKLILRTFQPAVLHVQDLDIKMIAKAKKYLGGADMKKISLSVGDAVRLPFQADSLDAIFGFGFLHHVPDWRSALAEISRVLKTGGLYYFEELYPELYQNVITKHILLHPEHDRFSSYDLRKGLDKTSLILKHAFELRKMGILGVAAKLQNNLKKSVNGNICLCYD